MSILIDESTTFIVQGITGREAVNLTRECLDYGSKVIGGVTPGRRGREVHGVPVFDSVAQLVQEVGEVPDGSVVTVPPAFTRDAVFEAIEAGVKLVVIVTERIPRYDVAQMVELANLRGARIIGPNCLGLIRPGVAKMGGIGGPAKDAAKAYVAGSVGVMSRSGGMTTEISSTLTAAGLAGSTMPIVAFMAGRFMDDEEMQGMSFGHAGTIVEGKEDSATEKIARLEASGIPVVERIHEIPDVVREK